MCRESALFKKHPLVTALGSLGLASTLLFSPAAFAQEEDAEIEEILVTGSRIQRGDLTANSPIEVIGQEEIQASNTVNLEEFLRERPQFTQALGDNTNNGNPGAATIDLRNLGEERTLVLVNGKRFTPYDYNGAVDLGMIPTSLVERVEIITGGASAVYGTDAIAGVVNFILQDDFEGADFGVSFYTTEEGDADRQDYNITVGTNFADDRGNVTFNVGFTDQDELFQDERDFAVEALDAETLSPFGSSTTPAGTLLYSAFPGDALGGVAQFDTAGNAIPFSSTYNFNPFNLFQVPQERITGTLLADFDFTEALRGYGRISYANNEITTIIAPTGTFFFPFSLNYATNPFLGPDSVALLGQVDAAECTTPQTDAGGNVIGCLEPAPGAADGFVDIALGRRLVELGTRDSAYENEALQYVFGLEGDLGESTQWEVFAQYGETEQQQDFLNDAHFTRIQQAMLAVPDGAGGVRCLNIADAPDCAPANFFGAGNLSQEAAQFIRLDISELRETDQLIFGGALTGDIGWSVPSADENVSYALGVEYRKDEGTARPDADYASGEAVGFGSSSPVDAETEIQEIFAEGLVPVLNSVSLELGIRYSEYENTSSFAGEPTVSNDFTNTSWKFGGDWDITDDLRARALFQRAVRAPNLAEIGLPLTPSTGDLDDDPCEGSNPVGNPDLTALCIATGVPAGQIGSVTSIIAGQIGNFLGGNAELEPEEADTWTVGLVYAPEAVPGLELAVDYYDITIEDVITQLSEQEIVTACYASGSATSEFCQRVVRSSITGGLNAGADVGVDVRLLNSAEETTKGWDLNANYLIELEDLGSLSFGFMATYTAEHEFQSSPETVVYDCAGLVGATCTRPDPEWRWVQTSTWEQGNLRLDLIWRYYDELEQDSIALGASTAAEWAEPTIDSYNYFDFSAAYTIDETWLVRLGVENLLDEEPPVVGTDYGGTAENSGNTYPATYDVLGRAYFVSLNLMF